MAFSHRQFIRNLSGRKAFNLNLNGVEVTRRSVALVTAAPCDLGDGMDPDIRLRVHGPDVWVSNVVPHGPEGGPGGIEYVITVAGDEPVDVAVTLTVLEPWDSFGFQ
jgi:hypothetical protein